MHMDKHVYVFMYEYLKPISDCGSHYLDQSGASFGRCNVRGGEGGAKFYSRSADARILC